METLASIDSERVVSTIGWIGIVTVTVGLWGDIYVATLVGSVLCGVGLVGVLYYYSTDVE